MGRSRSGGRVPGHTQAGQVGRVAACQRSPPKTAGPVGNGVSRNGVSTYRPTSTRSVMAEKARTLNPLSQSRRRSLHRSRDRPVLAEPPTSPATVRTRSASSALRSWGITCPSPSSFRPLAARTDLQDAPSAAAARRCADRASTGADCLHPPAGASDGRGAAPSTASLHLCTAVSRCTRACSYTPRAQFSLTFRSAAFLPSPPRWHQPLAEA